MSKDKDAPRRLIKDEAQLQPALQMPVCEGISEQASEFARQRYAHALPRDTERFAKLSPDKPAMMRPGWKFPSPEELAKSTLDHLSDPAWHATRDGN